MALLDINGWGKNTIVENIDNTPLDIQGFEAGEDFSKANKWLNSERQRVENELLQIGIKEVDRFLKVCSQHSQSNANTLANSYDYLKSKYLGGVSEQSIYDIYEYRISNIHEELPPMQRLNPKNNLFSKSQYIDISKIIKGNTRD